MSKIFNKNDFNISLKNINNGVLCDILSWEINNFDNEIKIINFSNNLLNLKIKNIINCQIDFNTLSYNCDNPNFNKFIKKSLDSDIIKFIKNFNLILKNNNIDIKKDHNIINWNPYDYLDNKKKYSFDINLLKQNSLKKIEIYNSYLPKEHIIDIIINELKILDDNNYELIFKDNNLFNFDVNLKIKNSYDIKMNIDLESYYYPYYPPLISFYDNFNDNLENILINLSYLKLDNWKSENKLINVLNHLINIINDNLKEIYKTDDNFRNLNLLISKIISLNKIKLNKIYDISSDFILSNKFFSKNEEYINIKNIFEIKLFKNLFNELNTLKNHDNLISFLNNSDLSFVVEYYIKKYKFDDMNIINKYNIYNIIFSIVDMVNLKIINLDEYNILKNKIYNYENTNNKLIDLEKSYQNILKNFLVTESLFKNYYFKNYHCSSKINKNSIKKITQELINFKNTIFNNPSIFITYDKYDCKNLMALIIESNNSFCENGCFIFHILCEDYPDKCPKIYFEKNDIIPILNIDFKNEINKNWNKNNSSILQILNLIQYKINFLLKKFNDLKYNDQKSNLIYQIYKYAILNKLNNPYEEFKEIIFNHFKLKKNDIILKIKNDNNINNLGIEIIDKLIKL